ncbi:MAG: EamA family transporter [Acidobacteriota bacterium]|nr:EamA family transporter [Acidobacteriota bacterium]
MTTDRHHLPLAGLLNLFVTYIVWGSTYLAIRVAVREGAGWGPFWLGAARVLVAAAVLFAVNRLRGTRLRPSRLEFGILAATGLLLWVGGNGAVNWAETRIDSGLAALIVGTMPLWVAFLEGLIDRRPPSLLLSLSLVTGFAGLVVLTYPKIRDGVTSDLLGIIVVVGAAVSWGLGSIIVNRRRLELDPIVVASWQQLVGGVGFAVIALAVREPLPQPTAEAWMAWAYLVVFGSLFAYTSFIYALKLLPTTVVMTYAYVNPVIAVLLGWLILSEPITGYTVTAMALIVTGVYGVFRDKGRHSEKIRN